MIIPYVPVLIWNLKQCFYRNDPKFSDRYAWANSADPDQTAPRGANSADPDQTAPDQGLHCLPFRLHRLDSLLYGRATQFKF